MAEHRIFTMDYARIHELYVAKAERKGRTRAEVERIVCWFTGHTKAELDAQLAAGTDVATFLHSAPCPDPARERITGVVCGVRVEDVEDPLMREVRRLDKLIDELAKGRPMERILRS
jgi:hypothetical protein